MSPTRRTLLSSCSAVTLGVSGCLTSGGESSGIPRVGGLVVSNYHDEAHTVRVSFHTDDGEERYSTLVEMPPGEERDPERVRVDDAPTHPEGSVVRCRHESQSASESREYDFSPYEECVSLVVNVGGFDESNSSLAIYSGRCEGVSATET
jgi:hypothetical protein